MFGFSLDKRYIYILLAILVISNLRNYTQADLVSLLLTLPAVIIAISFHEYAHAYAADKLGDDTPSIQGRLTLNPLKHLDPVGFVLLMFAGFGWGRPVEINSSNFSRNISRSKGEAIVSFAGPLMNIILSVVSAFLLGIIIKFNVLANVQLQYVQLIIIFMMQLIYINIGLGVFNLIPLPPLDGSKILRHFLPNKARIWFDSYQYIFYIIFIVIWVLGITSIIISPIINLIGEGILKLVYIILGI